MVNYLIGASRATRGYPVMFSLVISNKSRNKQKAKYRIWKWMSIFITCFTWMIDGAQNLQFAGYYHHPRLKFLDSCRCSKVNESVESCTQFLAKKLLYQESTFPDRN